MAKATKLPSGNWRVLVYSNGHRRSFTAQTKKEAEYHAAQFLLFENDMENMTVEKAVKKYIANRTAICSPTTIRTYTTILNNNIEYIRHKKIVQLKSNELQAYVNDLSTRLSPKGVRNAYGLVRASIKELFPNKSISVTLPQKEVKEYRLPTSEDISIILDNADDELKIAIMLASIGTLRIGEICGLEYSDINEDVIHIHQTMIYNDKKKWAIKDIPKTTSSDRYVCFPSQVIDAIGNGEGLIFKSNPKAMSLRYKRLVLKLNLDMSVRFHDLRHYAASAMHAMGIPDQYIMETGGWKSDTVLKSIYRNTLDDKRREFEEIRNAQMSNIFFGDS